MTSTISKKLRVLALFVALMMVLTCLDLFGAAAAADAAVLTLEEMEGIRSQQAAAMTAYEEIIASWANSEGYFSYPDAFGGFYISNGNTLMVKLLNNDVALKTSVMDTVSDTSVIAFENTDVSMNDLIAIRDNVSKLIPDETIVKVGISQKESQVNVEIYREETTPYGLQRSYEGIPHVSVDVVNSFPKMQSISYNTSQPISRSPVNSDILNIGTLGWYGEYNFPGKGWLPCFVTAGHVALVFTEQYSQKNMYFGGITAFPSTLYSSDYIHIVCGDDIVDHLPSGVSIGDYAFVAHSTTAQPNSDLVRITPNNRIQMGATAFSPIVDYFGRTFIDDISSTDYICGALPEDTFVTKGKGANETRSGYVTDTETQTQYYPNFPDRTISVTIHNLIEIVDASGYTEAFSESGDSGGPVFYSTLNGNTLLGFVQGGEEATEQGITHYTSFITPLTILLYEGFVPYPWCDE